MQTNELQEVALALRTARDNRAPITPPTKTWPALDADSAFEVQRLNVKHAVSNDDRLVGYKLGNIAKHLSLREHPLHLDHYIKPYVELEPAFVLRSSLRGPNVTVADVINAIDYAIPAIEIIDSRVENWAIDLPDTLADNGSTANVILGGTPRKLTDLKSLRDVRGTLQFNGREVMDGNTGNVLGNPLSAVAWLVNRLAAYDIEFQAGQVILPGSCLQAVPMDKPGKWRCTFEEWGTIEFDVA
ncbi:2-keto-4-pentenoate hydratase [Aspergillus brunneoviolaceus CBS 621.78]|uniref:TodF product hydratase n=1 Tax=Aspergillus brunneoviolaceus CBS 621.78 TaxID=1450534 RepID=A0ACD1FVD0_9EURO|nr:TodF product hydratase [Aspergillus brunneoviolaceus CBS 621.78]RAH40929.1 TodF product hydratase [Aspergillus brunneoviolaceus CBS 621.78]